MKRCANHRPFHAGKISLAMLLLILSGCGPEVSREELGEVQFSVPTVEPEQPPSEESP